MWTIQSLHVSLSVSSSEQTESATRDESCDGQTRPQFIARAQGSGTPGFSRLNSNQSLSEQGATNVAFGTPRTLRDRNFLWHAERCVSKLRVSVAWVVSQAYNVSNAVLVCLAAVMFVPVVVAGALFTLVASAAVHYLMSGYNSAVNSCEPATSHQLEPAGRRGPSLRRLRLPLRLRRRGSLSSGGSDSEDDTAAELELPQDGSGHDRPPNGMCRNLPCGSRPPSPGLGPMSRRKSVKELVHIVLKDEGFLKGLLSELPGVDYSSAPIRNVIHRLKDCLHR